MLRTYVLAGAAGAFAILAALASFTSSVRADEPAADKPAFTGPETCKKCHLKQFKSWRETKMSKSIEALKPGAAEEKKKAAKLDPATDYSKDPKCLKCHTTGYGTESGYPAVVEGKEWTDDEKARAEKLGGTSCEACHGPGSLYSVYKQDHEKFKLEEITKLGATSPPKVEQCMACHVKECPTMGADYKWDFEKAKTSKDVHDHVPLKYPH